METISNDHFQKLVEEKRHKELMKLLTKILVDLKPEDNTKDLTSSINKLISNQSLLPKAIQLMTDSIVNKLESLRKVENNNWLFQVKRDESGLITHVIAINK
jgi:hypothetical protein